MADSSLPEDAAINPPPKAEDLEHSNNNITQMEGNTNMYFRLLYERRRKIAIRMDERTRQAEIFPFLRLPVELRLRIYADVVGYRKKSVILRPKSWETKAIRRRGQRAFGFPIESRVICCHREVSPYRGARHHRRDTLYRRTRLYLLAHPDHGNYKEPELGSEIDDYPLPPRWCLVCGNCMPIAGPALDLSLLRICKQIAREVTGDLYANVTFVITSYFLLGALLRQIGEGNARQIRHVRVYYSHMPGRAYPFAHWMSRAWKYSRSKPLIKRMSNLSSLHLVNVIGAGCAPPDPRYRETISYGIRNGKWAGKTHSVWRNGERNRLAQFPALDMFSKIKIGNITIEIDERWLSGFSGVDRVWVDDILQLNEVTKQQHVDNIRERVTWKDPDEEEDGGLRHAIRKWNDMA